ncbi:MAG: hypothetical protein ACJ72E_06520 [Marmoricola sp.]
MSDAPIIVVGTAIVLAFVVAPLVRLWRRTTGRIIRHGLDRAEATYVVKLRQGEHAWRPGDNGRAYGPATASYSREDSPDGVTYCLELRSAGGTISHFRGPIHPTLVEGSAAHARARRAMKWAPLNFVVLLGIRLVPMAIGILVGNLAGRILGLATWIEFLVALGTALAIGGAFVPPASIAYVKAVARRFDSRGV